MATCVFRRKTKISAKSSDVELKTDKEYPSAGGWKKLKKTNKNGLH
jgi:hypothetical protein